MTPTLVLICNLLAVCSSASSLKAEKSGCWLWYRSPQEGAEMHMMIAWKNIPDQAWSCVQQKRTKK